ncbi:hypothetical protein TBLA_0A05620 [Henningerozyma blattae CBS 6284]|uniref:Retrograde transport protein Dsl1 C-terminal domain-containing protein n=1 Tax=Henningerozyma blattae (strain ATCC 34711 / CBS 6284 / DSM 70876 / NBRC 10599 / NRRL Y-10934 / UCD 77-7) TaxID=1071380 RepID=I2GW53_HENB6|nr:hypothetical protein TBLA_0A05620 [Tetrapisispora blattae CBS 6284]CCH58355.1 hypothetical protein TBLA_0A05620 [Tetrapisispora blattae CBS 6284]
MNNSEISSTLNSLPENKFPSILNNRDILVASIKNDIESTIEDSPTQPPTIETHIKAHIDPFVIQQEDTQLSNDLYELNKLKTITSLIMEFKTNYELMEYENCYYSLQNLRKKIHENEPILVKNYHLKQSLSSYADGLHVQLIEAIHSLVSKGFWKIPTVSASDNQNVSIEFQKIIHWGNGHIEFEYEFFIDFLRDALFPDSKFDLQNWLITELVSTDLQQIVKDNMDSLFNEYIQFSTLVHVLKTGIMNRNYSIVLTGEASNIINLQTKLNSKSSIQDYLYSLENIIEYLKNTLLERDSITIFNQIGNYFFNEIIKLIKSNTYIILEDDGNDILKSQISKICNTLSFLSKRNTSIWKFDEDEITHLLNNRQLQSNLLVDKLFETKITTIRDFFNNPKNLLTDHIVPSKKNNNDNSSPLGNGKNVSNTEAEDETNDEDDWNENWSEHDDDENAWGDEIDVDLESIANKSIKTKKSMKSIKSIKTSASTNGDDDDWDAWNDEVEIDFDNQSIGQKSINKKIPNNNLNSDELLISGIPNFYKTLILSLKNEIENAEIPNFSEEYYNYKLNILQTTFMVIAISKMRSNWIQLYTDIQYTVETNELAGRLNELNSRYLEFHMNLKKRYISGVITAELSILEKNDNYSNWQMKDNKLLPFIKREVFQPLLLLKNYNTRNYFFINFFQFLYEETITKKILNWNVISEKNSENLSNLISIIWKNTEVIELQNLKEYQELREKFLIVSKLLILHLKDIMEMFYNGDFYLFTTEELIQWVILLFADTPLRKNSIEDIREIRGAAEE